MQEAVDNWVLKSECRPVYFVFSSVCVCPCSTKGVFIPPAVGPKAPAVVDGRRKASLEVIWAPKFVQEVFAFLPFPTKGA